jgi:hypothetical protein
MIAKKEKLLLEVFFKEELPITSILRSTNLHLDRTFIVANVFLSLISFLKTMLLYSYVLGSTKLQITARCFQKKKIKEKQLLCSLMYK